MKRTEKAIKALSLLNDEEKATVADYFKTEVEEVIEEVAKVVVKEEVKTEEPIKEEPVKGESDITKLMEAMNEKFTALEEKINKSTTFGVKAKPITSDKKDGFDDMFAKLSNR